MTARPALNFPVAVGLIVRRVEESIIAGGYTGRVLRGQPGAVGQVARRLR